MTPLNDLPGAFPRPATLVPPPPSIPARPSVPSAPDPDPRRPDGLPDLPPGGDDDGGREDDAGPPGAAPGDDGDGLEAVPPGAAPAAVAVPPTSLRAVPPSERPRERLILDGPEHLRTGELIGLLLRTGLPGSNAVVLGEALHRHFGSLATLGRASHAELARLRGVGPGKAALLLAALELGRRVSRESIGSAPLLDTPSRIAALLADTASGWKAERMVVLLLNTRCRLIRMETVTEGLVDQVLVHPREIFRPAIASGAHSIVMVHNHPSGDPTPSEADIRITRDILRAGSLLRIEVLDHVILGRPTEQWAKGYSSLRELGHLRLA